ncbi:hypothetical protein [Pseudomonas sp. MWU318]|uniref:hypothetical protein n=1 Tax=Pseudomonas sp. MWU318 TaxID=2802569 RepID=UPI0019280E79|nr:hypothetical protein [Pseudomonas sp. MWU318]
MSNNSEKNWWEFYGIRYAQGTVIGAMIVYFLFSQNSNLKKLLFMPTEAKDFGVAHLTLLAIYGLTYCYIASAPILVMHAGRALIFKSAVNPTPYKGASIRILSLLTISIGIPAFLSSTNKISNAETGALTAYLILVLLQLQIVTRIISGSWSIAITFYTAIIDKRKEPKHAEYIESYRHMREHGNSFLIVIFQMLLAVPLYILACSPELPATTSITNLFMIIFFWTVPAAFIWAYATKIENNIQNL